MMDTEHVAALVAERDALRARVKRLRGNFAAAVAFGAKASSNAADFKSERDALRAEVERLRAALERQEACNERLWKDCQRQLAALDGEG